MGVCPSTIPLYATITLMVLPICLFYCIECSRAPPPPPHSHNYDTTTTTTPNILTKNDKYTGGVLKEDGMYVYHASLRPRLKFLDETSLARQYLALKMLSFFLIGTNGLTTALKMLSLFLIGTNGLTTALYSLQVPMV